MGTTGDRDAGKGNRRERSSKADVRSANLLGVFILIAGILAIHVVAALWPPPVTSASVVETTETEARQFEATVRSARDSLAVYHARPAGLSGAALTRWQRDSARFDSLARDTARLRDRLARADSLQRARAREVGRQEDIRLLGGLLRLDAISLDLRLILLAMAVGALGAFVHVAQSFATYVGNEEFRGSWSWWYLLRLPIGATLGGIFYFAVRGALLPGITATTGDINPFGVAALAALAGMFSKQAIDKLDEVFTTLFRPAPGSGDAARKDSLTSAAAPQIMSVVQDPIPATGGQLSFVVTGKGFAPQAKLHLDGAEVATAKL